MIYMLVDPNITEQAAAAFVAKVAGHATPGTRLKWPLVVSSEDGHSGVPFCLLDGDGALWWLSAGNDSAERMVGLEGGGQELAEFRNGNEVARQAFG